MTKLVLPVLLLIGILAAQHTNAQQAAANDLSLNGLAVHAQLRNDIYIAAVYTEVSSSIAQMLLESEQNKRMELRVLTDRWSARSFAAHWNQALLINNSAQQLALFEREVRQFTSAIRGKLIPGDKVAIDYRVRQYTQLTVNGVPLLTVKRDPLQFFQLLLRCWIGPRPPSSEFKNNILNFPTGDDATGLLTRYEALLPVSGRNKTIMAWRRGRNQTAALAAPSPQPRVEQGPAPKPAGPTPAPGTTKQQARDAAAMSAPETAAAKLTPPQQAAAAASAPAGSVGKNPAPSRAARQASVSRSTPETLTEPIDERAAARAAEAAAKKSIEDGLLSLYKSNLLKRVYGYVIYPSRAIDRNQEGTVVLQVKINRKGKVLSISNDEPSRYRLLNSAATKAVKKASPFPAPPSKLKGKTFDLEFPIVFRIPR